MMKSLGARTLKEYLVSIDWVMRRRGVVWARGRRMKLVTHDRRRWRGQKTGMTLKPHIKWKWLM
jgi:hypothetical protein